MDPDYISVNEQITTLNTVWNFFLSTVFLVTAVVYFPNIELNDLCEGVACPPNTECVAWDCVSQVCVPIFLDSGCCVDSDDCPGTPSNCLTPFCNADNRCELVVPGGGNCFTDSMCLNEEKCDENSCQCTNLCDGVDCPNIGCNEQRCEPFTGQCVSSGIIPNCCQNSTECPILNTCLRATCENNQCDYSLRAELFNGARGCDLQNAFIVLDNTPLVTNPYFFECGYRVAIYGNLTARVCRDYQDAGAIDDGGKIQMTISKANENWVDTDSFSIIQETNPGFSGVDIYEDLVIQGIEFVDDPVTGENTGIAIIFRYNFETNMLEQLQTLAPGDLPDFTGGENFGRAVGITEDFAIVGAPLYDEPQANSGCVVVFSRTPGTDTWVFLQIIFESFQFNTNLNFGSSLSVVADALMIGAPRPSGIGSYTSFYRIELGVWAFQWLYPLGGSSDSDHRIGIDVTTDGISAMSGSRRISDTIQATVYILNITDGLVLQTFVRPEPTRIGGDEMYSSSLSVNGDSLIVGCPRCDGGVVRDTGAAYFYLQIEGVWDFYKKSWPMGNSRLVGTRYGWWVDSNLFSYAVGARDWSPQPGGSDLGAIFLLLCYIGGPCPVP